MKIHMYKMYTCMKGLGECTHGLMRFFLHLYLIGILESKKKLNKNTKH